MSGDAGLLSRPALSATIAATWLLANNSVDPGHVILAVVFGLVLPRITRPFWPNAPRLRSPGVALKLLGVFMYDIIVANFRVAALVLGPNDKLRPAFLEVPLDIEDSFGIALLASMLTLTPGTVSAHVREGERVLLVHALDVGNDEEAIAEIKERYEAPLRKALGC